MTRRVDEARRVALDMLDEAGDRSGATALRLVIRVENRERGLTVAERLAREVMRRLPK